LKILLVEKNIEQSKRYLMMLETGGFSVIHVQSCNEAINSLLRDSGTSILFIGIDSLTWNEGISILEESLKIRNLPVIFLSSMPEDSPADKIRSISRYCRVIRDTDPYMILSSAEILTDFFETEQIHEHKIKILDQKEKTFTQIFHLNPVVLAVSTISEGLFIEVNENFLDMLGLTRDEVIGKRSSNLNLWGNEIERTDTLSLLEKNGYIRNYEKMILTKKGEIRYGLFSVDFIEMNGEKCILSAMVDITESKNSREAVIRGENNLKDVLLTLDEIVNAIPSGLFIYQYCDPDKLYLIKGNIEAEKITGIRSAEWIGKEFNEIWPCAAGGGITRRYLDVIHTGENIGFEDHQYGSKRLQGEFRVRVFNIPGKRLGVAFENISKIKMAEKALIESEAHYHILADHMSDAVWLMDLNLNTTYHSPSSIKIRGYTAEEIMAIPIEKHITGESFARSMPIFLEEMSKVQSDPEYTFVRSIELEFYRKDGSSFWADCTFTFIRGKNGNPDSILGEGRDITDRKTAEEHINKLLKEKETLLKEVHHRIKNNMQTISSLLYLQARTMKDSSAINALNDANNRVRSMMLIYDRLYQSSDFREISTELYLTDLIDSIKSTLGITGNIEIIADIENFDVNSVILYPVGIIINELLTNAFKYAYPGNMDGVINISLKKNSATMELVFSDNGIGISGKIFDSNSDGFGINLVKLLVEQINGKMSISGLAGTRYTISVTL